jgi:hypothetical protein
MNYLPPEYMIEASILNVCESKKDYEYWALKPLLEIERIILIGNAQQLRSIDENK